MPTAEERAKNRDKVSSTASNATLTTKVKTALASDVGMKTMTNIDVDSNNGVVTLKGRVDSADAKKKAEEEQARRGKLKVFFGATAGVAATLPAIRPR